MSWLFSSPGSVLAIAHLLEDAGVALDDAELANVAAKFLQALDGPGREHMLQAAARNAELLLQHRAVLGRVKQAQGRLVHRRALERVERHLLHQVFQALGDRALAPTHRAQQVEDLLALLQPLRGMAEEAHHLVDGVLHAVELGKRGVAADHLVGEQARQVGVAACVHHLGLANGREHALCGTAIGHGLTLAQREVLVDRHLLFAQADVACCKVADGIHKSLLWRHARSGRYRKTAWPGQPCEIVVAPCSGFEQVHESRSGTPEGYR